MALNKITNKEIEEKQVASLPDRMTGTAAENKAAFDALTKALITKYNELIDTLLGQGGAAAIGSEPFAGVDDAATVRDQLMKLQENIANAVSGSIPDASITEAKLADNAVSAAKIADGAVTAAKIADGEIVNAKIRDLTIETSKLANEAVTDAKLAANAVTEGKIADGAVTANTLAESTIEAISSGKAKIQTGSYVPTGTNQISLTFEFKPKFVTIYPDISTNSSSSSGTKNWTILCFALTDDFTATGIYEDGYSKNTKSSSLWYARVVGNTLDMEYRPSSAGPSGDGANCANYKYNAAYLWGVLG